jgi:hypothetical protein
VASLALRLVCTAACIPRAARQLTQESGLIPWLAAAAEAAIQRLQEQHQGRHGSGAGTGPGEALAEALQALRRLLQLRAVMRGSGGGAAAQQMAAAARQLSCAVLPDPAAGGGSSGMVTASVCLQVLPFVQQVAQQLDGSSQQLRRALPAGGADLGAAADAMRALLERSS